MRTSCHPVFAGWHNVRLFAAPSSGGTLHAYFVRMFPVYECRTDLNNLLLPMLAYVFYYIWIETGPWDGIRWIAVFELIVYVLFSFLACARHGLSFPDVTNARFLVDVRSAFFLCRVIFYVLLSTKLLWSYSTIRCYVHSLLCRQTWFSSLGVLRRLTCRFILSWLAPIFVHRSRNSTSWIFYGAWPRGGYSWEIVPSKIRPEAVATYLSEKSVFL